jgi:hypothetical protein
MESATCDSARYPTLDVEDQREAPAMIQSHNTDSRGPLERALVDELRETLRQRGIVFWLDKDGHYTGLVDRLCAAQKAAQKTAQKAGQEGGDLAYPVVPFRGSYLEMMLALEPFANELVPERVLIHMPGHTEASVQKTPMLELYEIGFRFRKALPTLIEQVATGLLAPADVKALTSRPDITLEAAERAIALKLGERTGDLDAVLQRMELSQVVESALGGEAALVASPEDVTILEGYFHRHLGFSAEAAERVLSGQRAPLPREDREPTTKERWGWLRSQLAAWLLGVEFVRDLRRPPRSAALAALAATTDESAKRCRELAEHLRKKHEDLYLRLANAVDTAVAVAEERHSASAQDLGRIDTFAFEEEIILEGAIAAVLAGRWEPALAWATDRRGDASFWLRRHPMRRLVWALAEEGARLGKTIEAHSVGATGTSRLEASTLEGVVEQYTSSGFEVDRAHREFEQRWHDIKDPHLPHYSELLDIVAELRRRYRVWADETTRAFSRVCEARGFLPDTSLQQRTLFDEVVKPLVEGGEPTAVFLLDALRYEMGAWLADELRGETVTVELKARLAELPTITSVGMNALAPVARDGKLEPAVFGKGEIRGFRSGDFTVNDLETRARAMGKRSIGETARHEELADVVDATPRTLKEWVTKGPKLIVVAGLEVDGAGEAGFGLATFEHTLRQVRNAWHKLSAAGVKNFVFTADHGFLLQDATTSVHPFGKKTEPSRRHAWSDARVSETGMVSASYEKLGYKGASGYLLLREDTAVYETRSARAPFVHGGNSLQERVIPVLTVRRRRGPGQSTSAYVIEGAAERAVLGVQRVRVRVQLGASATGSLGFTGARAVRIALRAAGREDVKLRIREASGAGKLRGTELELPVSAEWTEVFFVLEATADDRVQVEAFAVSSGETVTSCVFTDFFDVSGTVELPAAAETSGDAKPTSSPTRPTPKRSEPHPASEASWKDHVTDPDYQRALAHIAAHGQLSEADLIGMITGRRARAFSREYDALSGKLPFRIRIEVAGGQKIYVKDGGR